jgi:dynein heavy chain
MEDEWLSNVLSLLSEDLKAHHKDTVSALSNEMRDDYHMSVKKAIVDFVLKDPRGGKGGKGGDNAGGGKGGVSGNVTTRDDEDIRAENFVK